MWFLLRRNDKLCVGKGDETGSSWRDIPSCLGLLVLVSCYFLYLWLLWCYLVLYLCSTNGLKSIVTKCPIPTGLARVSGSTSGYTYGLKSMVTIYAIPTGFHVLVALLVATPTDWSPWLPYMPSLRDLHVLASDAYLYQRTEVHSHYMSHPYGILSARARAIGSAHIATQCFSFGDSLHG